MNNLKTTAPGGMPIKLDDFRWTHDGIFTSFKALMSSYGIDDSRTILLQGCARSVLSGTVTIAEGYVSIGGELCFVPAHSYAEPAGGYYEYWTINETFDSSGTKSYQNASVNDTYAVRVGKISVSNVVPAGHTVYSDMKDVFQIINEKINTTAWQTLPDCDNEFPSSAGIGKYLRDSSGFVHLKGRFSNADPGTDTLIGRLPVGFRPPEEYSLNCISLEGSPAFFTIKIETGGDMIVETGCPQIVELNQITPFKV